MTLNAISVSKKHGHMHGSCQVYTVTCDDGKAYPVSFRQLWTNGSSHWAESVHGPILLTKRQFQRVSEGT